MDTKVTPKYGSHTMLLRPGRHYIVCYESRKGDRRWLTDAEYVRMEASKLVMKLPNGTERKIHPDWLVDIKTLPQSLPTVQDRAELLETFRERRARLHRSDEMTKATALENARRMIAERKAARDAGYRVVRHARAETS